MNCFIVWVFLDFTEIVYAVGHVFESDGREFSVRVNSAVYVLAFIQNVIYLRFGYLVSKWLLIICEYTYAIV